MVYSRTEKNLVKYFQWYPRLKSVVGTSWSYDVRHGNYIKNEWQREKFFHQAKGSQEGVGQGQARWTS